MKTLPKPRNQVSKKTQVFLYSRKLVPTNKNDFTVYLQTILTFSNHLRYFDICLNVFSH